jgi:hypothetical protein
MRDRGSGRAYALFSQAQTQLELNLATPVGGWRMVSNGSDKVRVPLGDLTVFTSAHCSRQWNEASPEERALARFPLFLIGRTGA